MEQVRSRLLQTLRKRLLAVDESPTVTRMFTFREHLDALLLLDALGYIGAPLRFRGTVPREQNSRRVQKVLDFVRLAGTPQYLRRTSLCLQMVDHINAICAHEGVDGRQPLLVRLCQGAVTQVRAGKRDRPSMALQRASSAASSRPQRLGVSERAAGGLVGTRCNPSLGRPLLAFAGCPVTGPRPRLWGGRNPPSGHSRRGGGQV